MTEDKQAICTALCTALQLTKPGTTIEYIAYDPEKQTATVHYSDKFPVEINVPCDSGWSLICNIIMEA
jgi:hypothetical protein